MSGKKKNKNILYLFLITLTILIAVIFFLPKDGKVITFISNTINKVISPITKIGYKMGDSVSKINDKLSEDDIELMKNKLKLLENENLNLKNIIAKEKYLKQEFELVSNENKNLIECEITARQPGNWFEIFTINKGKNDGIKLNDTVVVASNLYGENIIEALVGRVTEVFDNHAEVTSISNKQIKVSFINIRSQDGGILEGSYNQNLMGYMYDRNADIIAGDKIITSGLGGLFKKDIYIGEVSEVVNDENGLKKIVYVTPLHEINKQSKVFVVKDDN